MRILEAKDGEFKGVMGGVMPFEFDAKALTEDGEFEGYVSIYETRDQGDDIVRAGAFDESLRARPAPRVRMLWQHRSDKPIGVWKEFTSDSKGLYGKGKLLLSTTMGRETHELMKAGAVDGQSIGYRVREYSIDRDEGVRNIIKADLLEVSVVTFPMHPDALVSGVKGFEEDIDGLASLSDAERFLREAARSFSRKEATDFVSKVKKIAQREAEGDPSGGDVVALQKLTQLLRS